MEGMKAETLVKLLTEEALPDAYITMGIVTDDKGNESVNGTLYLTAISLDCSRVHLIGKMDKENE